MISRMEFDAWQSSDEWKIGNDMAKDEQMEGYPGIAHDFEQMRLELRDANSALKESIALLQQSREYILHKARRHDLNWREGDHIIGKIDYFFELGTVKDIQAT